MNTPNINPSITQTHPQRNLPLIQRQENADPEKYHVHSESLSGLGS
jgi:hypothetical protein